MARRLSEVVPASRWMLVTRLLESLKHAMGIFTHWKPCFSRTVPGLERISLTTFRT